MPKKHSNSCVSESTTGVSLTSCSSCNALERERRCTYMSAPAPPNHSEYRSSYWAGTRMTRTGVITMHTNCALDCIGLGGRRGSKRICTLSPRLSSVLITMNKKRRRWCDAAHRVRTGPWTGSEFECGRFHTTGVPPLALRKMPCV